MTTLLSGHGPRGREVLDDDVDLARDRALVERAQAGDRSAFDDLYQRYYRRLYRFCLRRLHDAHEAEDVSQEAFARAWRALPTFAGDRRFYPWLSVIASHLCTDVLRRRSRSTPVAEFHQGHVASVEDGGEELMLAAVDSDLVAKAFRRLSDRHQRILNLREGSGWSYQRIADHEGVGITAVETLLWRARQALKREFSALASADSRGAGVLGGLLSVAGLRRLLRAPLHVARRAGSSSGTWGPAVVVGSAVAATAMVVATALGPSSGVPADLPAASVAGTQVPVAPTGPGTAAAAGAPGTAPSSPRTAPPSGSGTGNAAGGLPPVPGLPVGSGTGSLGTTVNSAVNGLGSGLGSVTGTLGGTVAQLGSSLPGPLSAAQNLTDPLGQTLAQLPQQLTNTITQGSATTSSASSTAAGTITQTLSNAQCTVQGALNTVTGLASGLGGGPTGTTTCP